MPTPFAITAASFRKFVMKYSREIVENGTDSLSRIAALIAPGSLVLDLGIGTGSLGHYLAENKQCRIHGVDLSADAIAAAQHYELLLQADLEQVDALQSLAGNGYDAVVLADVLEHVRNPEVLLQAASALLSQK